MATALFVASCGNREDAASGISVNKQKLEIVDGEFSIFLRKLISSSFYEEKFLNRWVIFAQQH